MMPEELSIIIVQDITGCTFLACDIEMTVIRLK